MSDNRITFDHVRGSVYGWQVWPGKYGYEWNAYGPRGAIRGTSATKTAAQAAASTAEQHLRDQDRLPGQDR